MIFLIRLLFSFVGFIFFVSLTINHKPIFYYIYEAISPLTVSIQQTTQDFIKKSFNGTKTYTYKMFKNSSPALKQLYDEKNLEKMRDYIHIKSSSSSSFQPIKDQDFSHFNDLDSGPSMEDISISEKKKLNHLIMNNQES